MKRDFPTNNKPLINFRVGSDAKIFVTKHRLSIWIGAKRAKTFMQCVHIPTELPFCVSPIVGGWVCQVIWKGRGGRGGVFFTQEEKHSLALSPGHT